MRKIILNGKSLQDAIPGDRIQLPRRNYDVVGCASGGMGHVVFADLSPEPSNSWISFLPSRLALKISKCKSDHLEPELQKWALMEHENVLPLQEILESAADGMVAASLRCAGSLRTLIKKVQPFNEIEAYTVIRSCSEALAYAFHYHGIIHLDIKPDNILFEKNTQGLAYYHYLITDWGISTSKLLQVAHQGSDNNNMGTLPYMAPERLIRGYPSSEASDIFSLGMMWLELLCGGLPFDQAQDLYSQVRSGSFFVYARSMLEQRKVSRQTRKAILSAIQPNPGQRICSWKLFLQRIRPGLLAQIFR